jgi:hypothetical protein
METIMHLVSRVLSSLALAAALLCAPLRSHAADAKVYPGTICKARFPSAGGWNNLSFEAFTGTAANVSTSANLDVQCPITRDSTGWSTAFSSATIDVDGNGFTFSCTFTATDNNSTSFFPITRSTTSTTWAALQYSALSAGVDWTLFLDCSLPRVHSTNGKAFLNAVKVTEI